MNYEVHIFFKLQLTGANKASKLAAWLKSIDFDTLMLSSTLGKNGYLGFLEHLSDEEAKIRFPDIKKTDPSLGTYIQTYVR